MAPRIWVLRDETELGSFSWKRKEPGIEVAALPWAAFPVLPVKWQMEQTILVEILQDERKSLIKIVIPYDTKNLRISNP